MIKEHIIELLKQIKNNSDAEYDAIIRRDSEKFDFYFNKRNAIYKDLKKEAGLSTRAMNCLINNIEGFQKIIRRNSELREIYRFKNVGKKTGDEILLFLGVNPKSINGPSPKSISNAIKMLEGSGYSVEFGEKK